MNKTVVTLLVLALLLSVVVENDAWFFRVRRVWRRVVNWAKSKAVNYVLRKGASHLMNGKRDLSTMTDADYQAILKYVPADEKEVVLRYMRDPEGFAKHKDELLGDSADLNEDTRGIEDEFDDDMAWELAKYLKEEKVY